MKKNFIFICLAFFISSQCIAQPLLQASIGIGSTASRVKIYIKSNITLTTNISTLEFNVGVPDNVVIPTPTVVSSSNSITWDITPSTQEGYHNFYITTATSPVAISLTANTEYEVMELEFPSHTILSNEVSLVTLPDGGADRFALFMATGTPSSDGSNLYYIRPNTTVDNEFSYDLTGQSSGTTTSTATLEIGALPVKLSTFTASAKNNNSLLEWSVENQDGNSSHFEIERSADGSNFENVGSVNATNNSHASYTYTDKNVSLSGTVYYRLKMFDKDGQFSYSDIKTVHLNKPDFAVRMYPNPVQSFTKLTISLGNAEPVNVSVNDALGKQIKQIRFSGQEGENEKTLDLSSENSGTYLVTIQAGNKIQTISVIKN